MAWKPDPLLKALLIWTMLTLIIIWLPLVRGLMDGETYQWANSIWGMQIGGSGVRGDYWLLLVQAIWKHQIPGKQQFYFGPWGRRSWS